MHVRIVKARQQHATSQIVHLRVRTDQCFSAGVRTHVNDRVAANGDGFRPELFNIDRVNTPIQENVMGRKFWGSADLVLTFRNLHNWMEQGNEEAAFAAMNTVLKPGGTLGIVQHRQDTIVEQDPKAESGYVREDYVIALAEAAGFELVAKSEINANPKDTGDHPKGVWTLPPNFNLGDVDRDKYLAIGESDRMTLKFVKKP